MQVHISSILHHYTGGRSQVEASGATLADLLADLDARHPGLRFRVVDEQGRLRPHVRVFVDGEAATTLAQALGPGAEVCILPALSGGSPRHRHV